MDDLSVGVVHDGHVEGARGTTVLTEAAVGICASKHDEQHHTKEEDGRSDVCWFLLQQLLPSAAKYTCCPREFLIWYLFAVSHPEITEEEETWGNVTYNINTRLYTRLPFPLPLTLKELNLLVDQNLVYLCEVLQTRWATHGCLGSSHPDHWSWEKKEVHSSLVVYKQIHRN